MRWPTTTCVLCGRTERRARNHPVHCCCKMRTHTTNHPERKRPSPPGGCAVKRIGVLFGIENSFPGALVEEINARNVSGIRAEFALVGAESLPTTAAVQELRYAVLIDRISHELPFYRAYLKAAVLAGTRVLNNPFWQTADDKFLNYTLARRLGVQVPQTFLLPHKQAPNGLTGYSLRNLEFPLDWERVFAEAGVHGFLKPIDGGGWRDVYEVRSREEFFRTYDRTGERTMVYQQAVNFDAYFRCYVVGGKKVRVMAYDPHRPHAERYSGAAWPHAPKALVHRMEREASLLCQALGYAMNTVEFAVVKGVPYAIDFMNPVPDADPASVGEENFRWFVEQAADLAIDCALSAPQLPELRAAALLGARQAPAARRKSKRGNQSSAHRR